MQLKGGSIVVALAILGHASACSNDLTWLNSQGKPRCENEVVIDTTANCVGDAITKCPQYCDTACEDYVAEILIGAPGDALPSLADHKLTSDPATKQLSVVLVVDVALVKTSKTQFKTRIYKVDGVVKFGGPRWEVEVGDRIELTLVNRLGEDNNKEDEAQKPQGDGGSNTLHKPNTTNLHTHGLHVSGEAPYDYVLYNVEPGESQTYTYIIQQDHLPGHLWHHHGSTAIQTSGGMFGSIQVSDPNFSEGPVDDIPIEYLEILNMPFCTVWKSKCYGAFVLNRSVALHAIDAMPARWRGDAGYSPLDRARTAAPSPRGLGDYYRYVKNKYGKDEAVHNADDVCYFSLPNTQLKNNDQLLIPEPAYYDRELLIVNGAEFPTIDIVQNQWYRYRLLYASSFNKMYTVIAGSMPWLGQKGCEWYLLAHDGNYLPARPRKFGLFPLILAARTDFLFRCTEVGDYVWKGIEPIYCGDELDEKELEECKANQEGDELGFTDDDWHAVFGGAPGPAFSNVAVTPIATFSVQPSVILKTEIEPYHTNRPCYVQGTFNIPEDKIQEESLKFAFADGPIGEGVVYEDGSGPGENGAVGPSDKNEDLEVFNASHRIFSVEVGTVVQYNLGDADFNTGKHPSHIHINPVQLYRSAPCEGCPTLLKSYQESNGVGGFTAIGDWYDVFINGGKVAKTRQHIDRFTGDMVLHCHVLEHEDIGMMTIINITGVEGTTAYRDDYTANCGACYQDKDGPEGPPGVFPVNGGRAYCKVKDTIDQICQNVPGCEPDPDHDPFKYVERLGPPSPPQTLPALLNRRNLRFGYKEDVFCPEGCKPKED